MEIRWRGRGGGDLNASPPNPGDWPILITPQILTQSSNSDDHLCASNASTQSDHNRSKQIGEFHATLIGTRTKSCYANLIQGSVSQVISNTYY